METMDSVFTQSEEQDCDTAALWNRYICSQDMDLRNQLVLKYIHLVKKIAFKMYRSYRYTDALEELVNEGTLALIQCIEKFDLDRQVKFETYVSRRIQGSMMDYINKQNGYVRKFHEMAKPIGKAKEALEFRLGREPTRLEIAQYLEMSMEDLDKILVDIQPISMISLDQVLVDGNMDEHCMELSSGSENNPMEILDENEFSDILVKNINKLNKEQQLVLSLFYKEELTVREIADILESTPAHISQLRFQAIKKLKKYMSNELIVSA